MKNIKDCFQWNRKFPYSAELEYSTKYIANIIETTYGKILCDLTTLCELWMEFSDERYSAQFIIPNGEFIDEFVSWAKAKCVKEYEDEDYEEEVEE